MQAAVVLESRGVALAELRRILPLYIASLVVTLTGVGAVGMTVTSTGWTPLWTGLTVMGHAISLALRLRRVPFEMVFLPVMVLGGAVVLQQLMAGSPLVGLDAPIDTLAPDMAAAAVVGAVAVIRSFTLVTNGALVFSPVPAISMLALIGSTNPNAEIPVFFGLLVLGSLFITGYEGLLRRDRVGVSANNAVLFHLLQAWCVTLLVVAVGFVAANILQPILGPLSPFALAAVTQARTVTGLNNNQNQASVGAGPINLTPAPVYELFAPTGGRVRTGVLTNYTGRSWAVDYLGDLSERRADGETIITPPEQLERRREVRLYTFDFPRDMPPPRGATVTRVEQRFITQGYGIPAGIPSLGRIQSVRYPRSTLTVNPSGVITGNGHSAPGQLFDVSADVVDYPAEMLKAAPRVNPDTFLEPETLELPNSTQRVQELARSITTSASNDYDRVLGILAYIEKTCTYTLQEEPTPPGRDAAEFYLFDTKRGACDLAATAGAVMCRAVGIPARVAVGYVADEPLPGGGGFLIRQEHGHMWFEAFFEGVGWVPFDPAPLSSTIQDRPLSRFRYFVESQWRKIGGGGLDALLLVLVVFATFVAAAGPLFRKLRLVLARNAAHRRHIASSPAAATADVYRRALHQLARRGWARRPHVTPSEYLSELASEWSAEPVALEALRRLTTEFEAVHYGGQATPDRLAEARAAAAVLHRSAPTRPRASAGVRSRSPVVEPS